MLRLLRALDGADDDDAATPALPPDAPGLIGILARVMGTLIDEEHARTAATISALERQIVEQARLIAALRYEVRDLQERQRADDNRHGMADLHAIRLKDEVVAPFLLDEVERRLDEGIEFEVIADDMKILPSVLRHQMGLRQRWMTIHNVKLAHG